MRRRVWLPAAAAGVLIILGWLLVTFRVWGMRFSGYCALGLAALTLLGWGLDRLAARTRGRLPRLLRGVFLAGMALGLAVFLALEGYIVAAAHTDRDAEVSALIVLGAAVNGETPSLSLRTRLDAALDYLAARPEAVVVVSGGQGGGERISEAEAMRRYLTEHGVSSERILLEDRSTTTAENLAFSKGVLDAAGFPTDEIAVAVVTNDFHLRRALLLAEEAGLRAVGVSARTPYFTLRANYYIREAFAVAAWALLGYTG